MGQDKLLVITDQVAVSLFAVRDAIKVVRKDGVEQLDPLIITQATSDSKLLSFFFKKKINRCIPYFIYSFLRELIFLAWVDV